MTAIQRLLIGVSIVALSSIACRADPQLAARAEALVQATDECLYDVRDRGMSWERSSNCTSLSAVSLRYIEAGGFKDGEPAEVAVMGHKARATAWIARATSLAGGQVLSIW